MCTVYFLREDIISFVLVYRISVVLFIFEVSETQPRTYYLMQSSRDTIQTCGLYQTAQFNLPNRPKGYAECNYLRSINVTYDSAVDNLSFLGYKPLWFVVQGTGCTAQSTDTFACRLLYPETLCQLFSLRFHGHITLMCVNTHSICLKLLISSNQRSLMAHEVTRQIVSLN